MSNKPNCPRCGNNRQVWVNSMSGKLRCHRVGCADQVIIPSTEMSDTNNCPHCGADHDWKMRSSDCYEREIEMLKADLAAATQEMEIWKSAALKLELRAGELDALAKDKERLDLLESRKHELEPHYYTESVSYGFGPAHSRRYEFLGWKISGRRGKRYKTIREAIDDVLKGAE